MITNGVINNHDGSITVPKGVHTFEAHVPVVDDSIIETTEIASIQIGRHQGIGQIIDNDSQSIPDTNDIYLLLDTSTSMLRTGGKNRRKLQSLLALNTFSQDVERAGYQFQKRGNSTIISATELLQRLAQKTRNRAIKDLNNYTLIDNPSDGKNAENLDIHLIYDYHVQHKNSLSPVPVESYYNKLSLKMQKGLTIRSKPPMTRTPNQPCDLYQANKRTIQPLCGTGVRLGTDHLSTKPPTPTGVINPPPSRFLSMAAQNDAAGGTPEPTPPPTPSPAKPFLYPKALAKKTSPPQVFSTTTKASLTFSKTTRANGSGNKCKRTSTPPSIA